MKIMGYDYWLLIQGTKDGQVHDLDYFISSGSYHSAHHHYFINQNATNISYNGDKEMGSHQKLFPFNSIKQVYEAALPPNFEKIKSQLQKFISVELTYV